MRTRPTASNWNRLSRIGQRGLDEVPNPHDCIASFIPLVLNGEALGLLEDHLGLHADAGETTIPGTKEIANATAILVGIRRKNLHATSSAVGFIRILRSSKASAEISSW
jgi:hypothetical protein